MSDVNGVGGVSREDGAALFGAVPAWGNPAFAMDGAIPVYASFEAYQGGVLAQDWDTPYDPQADAFQWQINDVLAIQNDAVVSVETVEPVKRGRGRPKKSS